MARPSLKLGLAGPGRAGPGCAAPGWAGQGQAGPGRAGQALASFPCVVQASGGCLSIRHTVLNKMQEEEQ